ncbi:MAG TPA: gluconokinase [bacterium]|nr:gluconokinase [bacterium]
MIIILMGVAGSGKTTLGKQLSLALHCPFYDGDDFHSPEGRLKMSRGRALTDEDRQPWLEDLSRNMKKWNIQNPQTILACSALKQKYRDFLSQSAELTWVYLRGDKGLIEKRLEKRQGHYATTQLLDSQFESLEEPQNAIILDISNPPERLVETLIPHF